MRVSVLVVLCTASCSGAVRPAATPAAWFSTVAVGAPSAAHQLMSGFYDVEETWRWVGPRFEVKLGVPVEAGWRGADLFVDGFYPEALIRHHAATLRCTMNETALTAVLDHAGPVHAQTTLGPLKEPLVTVTCAISPTLPPGADARELGMVVSLIGLRAH